MKAKRTRKPAASRNQNHWAKLAAATLDSLQANVFIANPDLEIIYINDCAKRTLQQIGGDVRRAFGIEVDNILGLSIHAFHRDPRGVEKILRNPQALPHQADFAFGAITLQARINSIVGPKGEVQGYVVAWEDITYRQRLELDYAGQIDAIHRSQGVIEFDMDATILNANDNFLKTIGYTLEEVKGSGTACWSTRRLGTAPSTEICGSGSTAVSLSRASFAASAKVAGRFTFRESTARSSISRGAPLRS